MESDDLELIKRIAHELELLARQGQQDSDRYKRLQEDWEDLAAEAALLLIFNDLDENQYL